MSPTLVVELVEQKGRANSGKSGRIATERARPQACKTYAAEHDQGTGVDSEIAERGH